VQVNSIALTKFVIGNHMTGGKERRESKWIPMSKGNLKEKDTKTYNVKTRLYLLLYYYNITIGYEPGSSHICSVLSTTAKVWEFGAMRWGVFIPC
jgi:hypothetical protein